MPIRNRLIPTVPIWYLTKHCDRGSKLMGTLASDRQARLVSALSVIANTHGRLQNGTWLDNFNRSDVTFGMNSFRPLPSFRTM